MVNKMTIEQYIFIFTFIVIAFALLLLSAHSQKQDFRIDRLTEERNSARNSARFYERHAHEMYERSKITAEQRDALAAELAELREKVGAP